MTRFDKIKQAAEEFGYIITGYAFVAGAEWADANPNRDREVVPIDWEKAFKQYEEQSGFHVDKSDQTLIQQLVEKQLAGDK